MANGCKLAIRNLKSIVYRGGLVTFPIPATWREEYEPDGGGTFYEEGSASTLRLNVLTAKSEKGPSEEFAMKLWKDRPDRQIRKLPNGNTVVRTVHAVTEEGRELELHRWDIVGLLPPSHARVAMFTFTILASSAKDAATLNELELLDRCVVATEFAKTLGRAETSSMSFNASDERSSRESEPP